MIDLRHGFLGLNAEGWTALFTGALVCTAILQGYFILAANRVAEKAAKIAQQSADALQTAERAFVAEFISTENGINDTLFTFALRNPKHEGFDPTPVSAKISFKNCGKTPATIMSWGTKFHVSELCPDRVKIEDKYVLRYVIEAHQELSNLGASDIIPNSVKQSEDLSAGKLTVWLIGYIKFADVFGRRSMRHFVWRYERPMKCFVPCDFKVTTA